MFLLFIIVVELYHCRGVRNIGSLGNVNKLFIHECPSCYRDADDGIIFGFYLLGDVQDLELIHCSNLSNLDIFNFGKILKLRLTFCENITSLSCLADNKSLEFIDCNGITDVSSLSRVPLLKIDGCFGITTWGSLSPPYTLFGYFQIRNLPI